MIEVTKIKKNIDGPYQPRYLEYCRLECLTPGEGTHVGLNYMIWINRRLAEFKAQEGRDIFSPLWDNSGFDEWIGSFSPEAG